jgi:hypothetical protein
MEFRELFAMRRRFLCVSVSASWTRHSPANKAKSAVTIFVPVPIRVSLVVQTYQVIQVNSAIRFRGRDLVVESVIIERDSEPANRDLMYTARSRLTRLLSVGGTEATSEKEE